MSPVVRMADTRLQQTSRDTAPTNRAGARSASRLSAGRAKRVPGSRKIVNDLLPGFSRQLAAMLSSGMPIVTSLETLEEQADNPNFRGYWYGTNKLFLNALFFSTVFEAPELD